MAINKTPVSIVIPARLESTRLPRKLLADVAGKPLLQHTYERCIESQVADQIIIATNSSEIAQVAMGFGARVITSMFEYRCGSDRVADAAQQLGLVGIIVNVQGDEPQIDPKLIDELASQAAEHSHPTTAAAPLFDWDEIQSRHVTKVVFDADQRAMLFSRSPIPCHPDAPERLLFHDGRPIYWRHIGVYAFPAWALDRHYYQGITRLEKVESLEQLRLQEMGYRWRVIEAKETHSGIDTAEQLEAYRASFLTETC